MTAWVLIVSFAAMTSWYEDPEERARTIKRAYHIAMQEFGDLQACQHASVEAQKIAPGIRVVCVPKGSK